MRLSIARPLVFLREFVENPRRVGTLFASSRYLADRIVRLADVARAGHVVELGAGTGAMTRAILRGMRAHSRLTAIEISERLSSVLRRIPDDRLIVERGCAAGLCALLEKRSLPAPNVVVSGLPFSTIPQSAGLKILERAWSSLAPGGRFLAYQLRSHVVELAESIMGAPRTEFEWRNLPPLSVHCWRKPEETRPAPPRIPLRLHLLRPRA